MRAAGAFSQSRPRGGASLLVIIIVVILALIFARLFAGFFGFEDASDRDKALQALLRPRRG